jgi:hypothetical protein
MSKLKPSQDLRAASGEAPEIAKIIPEKQPFNPYTFQRRVPSSVYEEREYDKLICDYVWKEVSYEHWNAMIYIMDGTPNCQNYRVCTPTPFWNDIEIFRLVVPLGIPDVLYGHFNVVAEAFLGPISPPTRCSGQPTFIEISFRDWTWKVPSEQRGRPRQFPTLLVRLFPKLDSSCAFDFAEALAGASTLEEYRIAEYLWREAIRLHSDGTDKDDIDAGLNKFRRTVTQCLNHLRTLP